MNLVVDIIEIFLPELTSALAGPSSAPLANRLRRVGYGLFGLVLLYLLGTFLWCGWRQGGACLPVWLTPAEVMLLGALGALGLVALILARGAVAHLPSVEVGGQGTLQHESDAPDVPVAVVSRLELTLSRPFSPSSTGSYRKRSGLPWFGLRAACRGQVALETWQIEVEGVVLIFSLFASQDCFRLAEEGTGAEVRCMIVPGERAGMSVRLVDSQGSMRDLALIPQVSFRCPLLVFVDARPLAFGKP